MKLRRSHSLKLHVNSADKNNRNGDWNVQYLTNFRHLDFTFWIRVHAPVYMELTGLKFKFYPTWLYTTVLHVSMLECVNVLI